MIVASGNMITPTLRSMKGLSGVLGDLWGAVTHPVSSYLDLLAVSPNACPDGSVNTTSAWGAQKCEPIRCGGSPCPATRPAGILPTAINFYTGNTDSSGGTSSILTPTVIAAAVVGVILLMRFR